MDEYAALEDSRDLGAVTSMKRMPLVTATRP